MVTGRHRELSRVLDLVRGATAGTGGALVLRGEAGIGKTRLVQAAIEHAGGMAVLEVRGVESDAELPFSGLFDLLRCLDADDLAHVTAGLPVEDQVVLLDRLRRGLPVTADRFSVCTLLLQVLCTVAERRPVLLCVDDLAWLDPASADAVLFVARRIRHDPVAVLLAVRDAPDGSGPVLRGFDELPLFGLVPAAAADLLRERTGLPVTDAWAARMTAATGGNPLALIELARDVGTGDARSADDPSLASARRSAVELFRRRLGDLDDDARAALVLLALDAGGSSGLVWRAAGQAGIDPGAFERLEMASLVTIVHGQPRPAHPLIRSAVLAETPPAVVRAAHRAWAAATGGTADLLPARAWHLAGAALGPDPDAADALDEAATTAATGGAYGTAALALERSARLTAAGHRQADRLLRAGVAARWAGRPQDAGRLLEEAAAEASTDAVRATAGHRLAAIVDAERGRRHLYHGRVGEARRLVVRAADTLAGDEPAVAAEMLGVAAWTAMISADYPASVRLARRAHDLAGGAAVAPIVDLTLGTSLFSMGRADEGYGTLLAVAGRVEAAASVEPEYACFTGVALAWVGEFARGRALLAQVTERARAASSFGVLCSALHATAYVDSRTGHLISAYAAASEALATAETVGNDLWRYFSLGALAWVEAAQGRADECRAHADEALGLARTMEIGHSAPVREALGLLELAHQRPEEAIAHLEPVNRPGVSDVLTLGRPTGPDIVEAYVRAGRVLPPSVHEQVVRLSEDDRVPGLAAQWWRCRGLMAADADVDVCFEAALARHERADNPFALARTLLCHGEQLRRAGRRADARSRLTAAAELFEHQGARPWVARADAELRTAGAAPRPDRRPEGPDALTGQELQVALAVARGLTNREAAGTLYLSPKTVEFHLGNAYRKLGIRSRAALAARLAEREPGAEHARSVMPV